MNPDKPYPVLVIAAFVGFAIVLMVWALTGTHGRTSMDAAQKSSHPVRPSPPASNEKAVPAPTAPSNETVGDSDRATKVQSIRTAEAEEVLALLSGALLGIAWRSANYFDLLAMRMG